MIVQWTLEALQDREEIWTRISTDNPAAAAKMDKLFSNAANRLADYPLLGHPGIISGTRELFPHENYRLVYQIDGDTASILALVHTSRQWPPVF